MAEAESSKDKKERSASPEGALSPEESDSDLSLDYSDEDLDVDAEKMDVSLEQAASVEKEDGKDSKKKPKKSRSRRERGPNEELSLRERQQRFLNLLLPPWMRMGANRWSGGIENHTSRSAVKRKREDASDGEETSTAAERKFFWSCYKETGFPNRVNHAVAGHRDANGEWTTYSFGGYHADDDERTVIEADNTGGRFFKSTPIDVHRYDLDTHTCVKLVPPPEETYINTEPHVRTCVPGSRYGHSVCEYKGRVFMYGGRNDEDGSFSKVDCYDIGHNIWIKVNALGDIPTSRDGHACTILGEEMIVHGGFSADDIKFSSDILAFNMDTFIWRRLPNLGHRVPERDFHTATTVNGKLLVFGGRSDMFAPYFTANDVYDECFYYYDYNKTEWKKQDMTGYGVKGRRSHCAVAIGNSVLYFGGYNATTKEHFGDVFIVNTDTWVVSEIRPFGDAPCPRRRVGCALVGSDLFICGGTSPIEVIREGKKKEILHDHNDVYILHLLPCLEQLCTSVIIREQMDLSSLPLHLQKKIARTDPVKKLPIFENLG